MAAFTGFRGGQQRLEGCPGAFRRSDDGVLQDRRDDGVNPSVPAGITPTSSRDRGTSTFGGPLVDTSPSPSTSFRASR